jgi:type IV secretion system protein VirB9
VVDVQAVVGMEVSIRFADKEIIDKITPSDTADLEFLAADGSNIVWLKAKRPMPPQPVAVRTRREDGSPRDYVLQWTAQRDDPAPGPPRQVAANGPLHVEEVPPPKRNYCYLIRFNYPGEYTAAQIAAWKQRQDSAARNQAEIALRTAEASRAHNVRYIGQGDASIGPPGQDGIYDDGYTTTLHFPGNMSVPVIYGRDAAGKDVADLGVTVEQGGVVKLHGVYSFIRLRDGDRTLCITNLGYSAVGNNPGTGTTEQSVIRDVRSGGR